MRSINIKIMFIGFLFSILNIGAGNGSNQMTNSVDTLELIKQNDSLNSIILENEKVVETIKFELKDSVNHEISELKIKETELQTLLIVLKNKKENIK